MEDLTLYQGGQLPDTLEDLTQFVLVGQATLNAYMLKLRTVNKLSVAQEIRDQTLKEAQDVSTALIAAEQRIGEILLTLPKAQGFASAIRGDESPNMKTKTETISEMGYSRDEAKDYQTMAKNPEVVQRVIDDALSRGDVVTKTQVLKEIKAAKEEAKRQAEEMQKALEDAEAELEELRQREPETIVQRVEVVPEDYKSLKESVRRAEQEYVEVWHKSLDKDKKIKELESLLGRDKLLNDADRDVQAFTTYTLDYIRRYGGHVWAFEQLGNLSEPVRQEFTQAIKTLNSFAQQMLSNLEGRELS